MERSEVIRRTQFWLKEIVIGLNLCPFAALPFAQETVRYTVLDTIQEEEILAQLKLEIQRLENTPEVLLETSLLILPKAFPDFLDFNDFLYTANTLLEGEGWGGQFQIASFHPYYQFAGTKAAAPENYTNRAPFPILHLLREESVSSALETVKNPEEIYQRNIKTMEELGAAGIHRLWLKI
ncbi:MAG: DUF1415 domain-containing protein [Saprospiraceae bacterium]|nr:DUF1415 domain-containing protein [Saprospiraceae bacterium]